MNLKPGNLLIAKHPEYELIQRLGAGAFGEVWRASGPGGFDVAIKIIHLNAFVRAFELRSLDVMKNIRHPNLVSLFGYWQRDNLLFVVMELCDRTLQDRLAEAVKENQPGIPQVELLSYMADAAQGLDALNAQQVQHRDVKPANLLLLGSTVKVADFGLAKVLEETIGSNTGAGTLAYTAPECFRGELTQQSDQYSLAVTYYHLRTGQPLFAGNQAQVMYAHLEMKPDLSRLPPMERVVLAKALSKDPSERWRDCSTYVNELKNAYRLIEKKKPTITKSNDEIATHRSSEACPAPSSLPTNPQTNSWLTRELSSFADGCRRLVGVGVVLGILFIIAYAWDSQTKKDSKKGVLGGDDEIPGLAGLNAAFNRPWKDERSAGNQMESNQNAPIELTRDNPKTLLGTRSKDYSINGLRLGMTHAEVLNLLSYSGNMLGPKYVQNPSRMDVYKRRLDGSKGETILYLLWRPGEEALSEITVLSNFRESLAPNWQRLLTSESVDDQSPFKKEFIGTASRSKRVIDHTDLGIRHQVYCYEEIGLEVTHKRSQHTDEYEFAIVQPKR